MKCALIGLGMVSKTYGDALSNTKSVNLSKVYARNIKVRKSFCASWPKLNAVAASSIDEIATSDVDFVILTTPPNAREEIVDAISAAGKPILMEKPVERTLHGAKALVEMCEGRNVTLGIVLQHRARPIINELKQIMPQLGHLMAVEVNVPWWRPQSYYDEPGRGTYSRDGGGVLISQAIHTLDLMLSLTGGVISVTSMFGTTGFHKMEAEDFVCAGLRFESGAIGQLFATTSSYPGKGETITLHHVNGSAHLEAGQLLVQWQDGRKEMLGAAASSGAGADPMAFTSDWHRYMIEDFVEAIVKNREPLVTGRSALEVHRLIHALELSAQKGQEINLSQF